MNELPINQVVCGDCFAIMPTFQSESIDLIVTDPPYESLEKHRAWGTTTRLKVSKASSNVWFPIIKNGQLKPMLEQFYRILKNNSHCYLFCDNETSDILIPLAKATGFKVWKRIVWDKVIIGLGYHYRGRHEYILFLEKGKKNLNNWSIPDVLRVKKVVKGFPAEKPRELYDIFILNSSKPNDVVLDPFCGSGTVAESCLMNNRKFIAIDIVPEACDHTRKRVASYQTSLVKIDTLTKYVERLECDFCGVALEETVGDDFYSDGERTVCPQCIDKQDLGEVVKDWERVSRNPQGSVSPFRAADPRVSRSAQLSCGRKNHGRGGAAG